MTWRVVFLPAAGAEVTEAHDWYEREALGIGERFRAAIDEQVQRIAAHPLQFPVMLADVRRARLKRFPYALFFRFDDTTVYVVACFHSSRDPKTWQARA